MEEEPELLHAVVAPEELAGDEEARHSEDAGLRRLVGRVAKARSRRVRAQRLRERRALQVAVGSQLLEHGEVGQVASLAPGGAGQRNGEGEPLLVIAVERGEAERFE